MPKTECNSNGPELEDVGAGWLPLIRALARTSVEDLVRLGFRSEEAHTFWLGTLLVDLSEPLLLGRLRAASLMLAYSMDAAYVGEPEASAEFEQLAAAASFGPLYTKSDILEMQALGREVLRG